MNFVGSNTFNLRNSFDNKETVINYVEGGCKTAGAGAAAGIGKLSTRVQRIQIPYIYGIWQACESQMKFSNSPMLVNSLGNEINIFKQFFP